MKKKILAVLKTLKGVTNLKDWTKFLKPTNTEDTELLKFRDGEGWTLEDRIRFTQHQLNLLVRDLCLGNTDIAKERMANFNELIEEIKSNVFELDRMNPHTPILE